MSLAPYLSADTIHFTICPVFGAPNSAETMQYEPKRQIRISVLQDEYGCYGMDVRLHKVF